MDKNKPLSCTRGMHFYRKIGAVQQCMYCGIIKRYVFRKGFLTYVMSDGTKFTFKPNHLFQE